jgi:hypothetical protein
MTEKIDLKKIAQEIDKRKNDGSVTPLSESTQINEALLGNKSNFLKNLYTSIKYGGTSESTEKIKVYNNIINGKPIHNVSEVPQQPKNVQRIEERKTIQNYEPEYPINDFDREEQMYRDIEKKKKLTFGESLDQLSGKAINTNQPQNNYQQINQYSKPALNEELIVGNVKKLVDNYLNENYSAIIEESIKNAIVDIYVSEKILSVLNENEDFLEKKFKSFIQKMRSSNKKT